MKTTTVMAVGLLCFVGGSVVRSQTQFIDPDAPFAPLRFGKAVASFNDDATRSGYGVALRHTAGSDSWEALGRNTWRGKASRDWLASEWLTFGSASSQRPHAGIFIDRARDKLRYVADVEETARRTKAFKQFELVFPEGHGQLASSIGLFDTVRFGYRLSGGTIKNCTFFHANAITRTANMGGFVCRRGLDPVSNETLRCFVETVRVRDLGVVGRAGEDCRSVGSAAPGRST